MNILVISDSLALPRDFPEKCEFESTWPQMLKKKFNVYQISIGGATIEELTAQIEYHKLFPTDVIIVQSGIVDCAPRAMSKLESLILNRFWILRKTLGPIVKKKSFFLRKHRNITYTNPTGFQNAVDILFRKFNPLPVYWVGIVPGNEAYEEKVPNIISNIDKYNKILFQKNRDKFISLEHIPRNAVMSDHIHLNALGHKYVYEKIMQHLDSK